MRKKEIFFGLGTALVVAFFFSPFASAFPDGLEKVAKELKFLDRGQNLFTSPVPDYLWPGVRNASWATSLAGFFGTLLVFGLGLGLGKILKKKSDNK